MFIFLSKGFTSIYGVAAQLKISHEYFSAVVFMPSSLPSSFSRPQFGSPSPDHRPASAPSPPQPPPRPPGASSGSSLPLMLALIALIVSLACLYATFFADRPMSPSQKAQLLGIADSLRSLQNREIQMSAPLQTFVYINATYPIKDMFPLTFDMPLDFEIPIDTQMVAVSTTGQPVAFRVQENVPIKVRIPINSARAFGNSTVQITKSLPLQTTWSSDIKVRAAYGQDLNSIIDKLETMAGETPPSAQ